MIKGIQYFSDKDHEMTRQEVFESQFMSGAVTLEVSETPVNYGFLGFGVAITGASCYELFQMEPQQRRKILEDIYSEDGLNLSVARLSVGASDYSAELYSYDDEPFDTALEHFSVERDKEYIIPMIKEILEIRPDLYLFASPWSPPGWMKTGGQMCGGYMRREYIDCYAEYFIRYLKAYEEEGIIIRAVTPQNEPETHQFGKMPACIWHPEIESSFILSLKKKLKENNLDVKVWMYDHSFTGTQRVLWMLENTKGLKENCDGAAFHYYDGAIEETMKIRKQYPDLELHFTEGGPRLFDHYGNDWCKWGIMCSKALNLGYRSFTSWNLILNECGGPDIGPFFCGGLVTEDRVSKEIEYSGQYKTFRHIAPFIHPDSKIYAVSPDPYFGECMSQYPNIMKKTEGFLIENKTEEKVLVLVNPNQNKMQFQIRLEQKWYYVEMMPESICTIVFQR